MLNLKLDNLLIEARCNGTFYSKQL